ncbi:hypothetical protein [Aestuariicoccus sp. MJ-SS9]|uniref:hypothetical protein n=1 Tax=Aestuariicoccus sp. MJ-SS9 TaxID=3079855 RepID=UPI00290855DE|nr:hypothetical protein [Aestuariicoccus sp. MJ-SS9]MDU8911962.1 hypothetical protein [Aestuariicoccus sp. MJ-SS9]
MAFFDAPQTVFAPLRPFRQIASALGALADTPFARRQRLIAARIAAFRSLSDEELAQMGLTRDAIVPYVFRTTRRGAQGRG